MKKKQKNKIKPNGWGTPLNLAIAAGVLLGLTVWFSPTKKTTNETAVPEITDAEDLETTSEELDNTDPDEIDTLMLQLEQDFSTF